MIRDVVNGICYLPMSLYHGFIKIKEKQESFNLFVNAVVDNIIVLGFSSLSITMGNTSTLSVLFSLIVSILNSIWQVVYVHKLLRVVITPSTPLTSNKLIERQVISICMTVSTVAIVWLASGFISKLSPLLSDGLILLFYSYMLSSYFADPILIKLGLKYDQRIKYINKYRSYYIGYSLPLLLVCWWINNWTVAMPIINICWLLNCRSIVIGNNKASS